MISPSSLAIKASLLIFGLVMLGTVRAQQADCPPGTIQIGSGQDLSNCVPDNSQPQQTEQSHRPPPYWLPQWGAIATNEPRGVLGVATNMPSAKDAERSAMANCRAKGGGSNCILQISYGNECAVIMVGDKAFNVTPGSTINEATRAGMKICTANGNSNCHVYYSACSLAKIQ